MRQTVQASRERLGVDYIDLLLVHWPNPDQDRYVDAVQGLQTLLDSGDLRAIGVSNFKPAHLQRVLDETGIVPDVNQIQLSPYSTRAGSRAYHAEHGIVTESYSPLGASGGALRTDPAITEIARVHDKSATQVVLRWHVQLGLVAIPRSGNPGRIAENIDIFDFELTSNEMNRISALDRGEAGHRRFRPHRALTQTTSVSRPLVSGGANACDDHASHGEPLQRGEELGQQDDRRQCRRGRLQAHQDAEDARRDPPQGGQLEAVRDDRAEQADRQTEQQHPRLEQGRTGLDDGWCRKHDRADQARHGEPRDARPAPAGLRAEQDVAGPGERRPAARSRRLTR